MLRIELFLFFNLGNNLCFLSKSDSSFIKSTFQIHKLPTGELSFFAIITTSCTSPSNRMLWHYVGGAPGRWSLCLFWCKTQTKGLYLRSPMRPEVEEERKVWEKTEGQLKRNPERAVDNGEQLVLSWLSREWQSQQKSERRLLRPDEQHRGQVNQRKKMLALLVLFVEVFRKIHGCDSLWMHWEYRVTQNSISCTWSWPKSILFICSSFHPLGCIFLWL